MININNQTINLLASNILVIEFEYGARPLDVIWGQLKKTTNSIYKSIQAYGFTVIKRSCSVYEKDKTCVIAFLMESVTIPKLYYRTGPEVFRHEDVDKFIESNRLSPLIWMDNDTRIKCLMFREHKNVVDYLEFIIKSRADMIGITKGLKHDFFNSVRVFLVDKQFLKKNEQVRNNAIYKLLYTDERIF